LAAHLAVHLQGQMRPCLLVDDDPQGSLTLWNEQRAASALPLKIVKRDIAHIVKKAEQADAEWVLIDTPPNNSVSVIQAIEAATLVVIPCRPGLFDLEAVQDTIALARHLPYALRSCFQRSSANTQGS
jgi:chromosome partitioning protein